MKYRLNTTNYHDFATFAVNKLPARSYFIPYPGRAAADARGTETEALCIAESPMPERGMGF